MLSDLILEYKATNNWSTNADIQKQEKTVTDRGKLRGSLEVYIVNTHWKCQDLLIMITLIIPYCTCI
jgi:hypothetical protein